MQRDLVANDCSADDDLKFAYEGAMIGVLWDGATTAVGCASVHLKLCHRPAACTAIATTRLFANCHHMQLPRYWKHTYTLFR